MKTIGKVNNILSICVQLANEATKIIHSIQTGGLKGEKWKGQDDPMTVADVKAQTLILKGIRKFYPNITIVGEEQVEYEGELGFDFNKLNPELIPAQYFEGGACKNMFCVEDVVVWVDPLDGTLSYVKEEYDAVTTLIGVSIGGKPLMGIIGQAYLDGSETGSFKFWPKIFFGHIDIPRVYYAYGSELDEKERTHYLPYELRIKTDQQRPLDRLIGSTSKHRVKQQNLDFINKELCPTGLVQSGGSGKKALLVLEQKVDFCVHMTSKASRWDTISAEVLLHCLGGQLTSIHGKQYDYDATLKNYNNLDGGLYTLRKDVHEFVLSKMKDIQIDQ